MILLQHQFSLKQYNTFGIETFAEYFTELQSVNDILELTTLPYRKYILGGGSNILLCNNINGIVIHNAIKGITITKEDTNYVWLNVMAGEIWHDLVLYSIDKGWGGLENLAFIPGTVGAAPIQNIGAYGSEVKNVIESVFSWHWEEKKWITLSNSECNFGYRDSIFKNSLKDKTLVCSVVFKLKKQPDFNISYNILANELKNRDIKELSVKVIADAVIHIRTQKLPNPREIGNAGSFFKNPTIATSQYADIQKQYAGIPCYTIDTDHVKIPAGWLIEQCGFKGYITGHTGVHKNQALVLVNYGNATGHEIIELAENICTTIKNKFGIMLEMEVQIWK